MIRSASLAMWVFVLTLASFALHELGHGLGGAVLGYDMLVGINRARPVGNSVAAAWHADVIIAAGPAITILQGFLGVALTVWAQWRAAFWIVLTALSMRALGAGLSAINPNDEAKLGLSWGLGYWTVHAGVIVILLGLTLWAARSAKPSVRDLGIAAVFIILGITLAVALDARIRPYIVPAF